MLIDLWDHDTLNARDFMGYVEVSLNDLITCAENGSPLQVQGPQGKEDAGRLYVEKALVGFPQVNSLQHRVGCALCYRCYLSLTCKSVVC